MYDVIFIQSTISSTRNVKVLKHTMFVSFFETFLKQGGRSSRIDLYVLPALFQGHN